MKELPKSVYIYHIYCKNKKEHPFLDSQCTHFTDTTKPVNSTRCNTKWLHGTLHIIGLMAQHRCNRQHTRRTYVLASNGPIQPSHISSPCLLTTFWNCLCILHLTYSTRVSTCWLTSYDGHKLTTMTNNTSYGHCHVTSSTPTFAFCLTAHFTEN